MILTENKTGKRFKKSVFLCAFLIAFICIPELIGNHDSIESFTPAKPIVRRIVRIILSILLVFAIFALLGLLMDNGLL